MDFLSLHNYVNLVQTSTFSISTKPKEKLSLITLLLFNGCILSLNEDSIALRQKGQGKKIDVINANSLK